EGGKAWSTVFWSPQMGDKEPPLLVAYTCNGLVSTWHAIYVPGGGFLERIFDLPFAAEPVVHREFHFDIPTSSGNEALDYAIDFKLGMADGLRVMIVSGTLTVSAQGRISVTQPHDF